MISILILTKNEQQDLPGCLQSVAWSDDIHVYDSMSTDSTVAVAKQFGATITQRSYGDSKLAFGGDEAAHRNWGLQNIAFKHPWVFVVDADPDGHPKLLHLWPPKLPQAGRLNYQLFGLAGSDLLSW